MINQGSMRKMDERERLAWFMANRGTLIAAGAVSIAMIGWELTHDREPIFLLIMVPLLAIFRAGLYFFYGSRPFAGTDSDSAINLAEYGKKAATLLLIVAALLPIYRVEGFISEETRSTYVWDLIRNDIAAVIPLAIIYLWPLLIVSLSRQKPRWAFSAPVNYAEPFFAVLSSVLVLWFSQLIFETRTLFFIVIIPVTQVPAWGCYLVVTANGLYLVSWLAGLLRPWSVQE